MENKQKLLSFLKGQKYLAIGTQGAKPWIVNVFHGVDDDFNIYFVSGIEEEHSRHITENPEVTFSTVWFDANDHANRKGVQARGMCHITTNKEDIIKGVELHNHNFPEFKDRITVEYIESDDSDAKIWVIKPTLIKYWDDELYGEESSEVFNF